MVHHDHVCAPHPGGRDDAKRAYAADGLDPGSHIFVAEVTVELSTNNKDERKTPQKLAIVGFVLSSSLLVLSTYGIREYNPYMLWSLYTRFPYSLLRTNTLNPKP